MTFDRAGSRLFTRGTDATPIPGPNPGGLTDNAAIHVFAVDPFTGALSETSTYRGYGQNAAWVPLGFTNQLPFVPGNDAHLHGLVYSRRSGIDILYNAYQGDQSIGSGEGFSLSALDVTGGTIAGDHVMTGQISPFQLDIFHFSSQGGGVFTDRSGQAMVLTGWQDLPYGISAAAYYPTDVTGKLLAPGGGGFNAEGSLHIGNMAYLSNPTHGAFIGVQH
jgi:hypothetical protein